jgi:hypothetical protein
MAYFGNSARLRLGGSEEREEGVEGWILFGIDELFGGYFLDKRR